MFKRFVAAYRLGVALLVAAAAARVLADRSILLDFSVAAYFDSFAVVAGLLFAAAMFAVIWKPRRPRALEMLRAAAATSLIASGILYLVLLPPILSWADAVLYIAAPVAVVADWLLVPPRRKMRVHALPLWLALPMVFICYSLIRGHITGNYAYPFLDPALSGGYPGVVVSGVVSVSILVVVALVVLWSGEVLRRYVHTGARRYPTYTALRLGQARRGFGLLVLFTAVAGLFAVSGWTGQQLAARSDMQTSRHTADAPAAGVSVQTGTYQGRYFDIRAAYLQSGHPVADHDIRHIVDTRLKPCLANGMQRGHGPAYTCDVSFEIEHVTDNYLAIVYTFDGSHLPAQTRALLYDRHTGKRITPEDIFRDDTSYAHTLATTARSLLASQFADAYETYPALLHTMHEATAPQAGNFTNLLLTSDESLVLLYDAGVVAPNADGPIRVTLPTDHIRGMLRPSVAASMMPHIEAQQAKEREHAQAARERAEAADAARLQTRQLTSKVRGDTDCAVHKCIALTFDDGPHEEYGHRLIDILEARDAAATFFVLGDLTVKHPELVKRMAAAQQEVGNHSWSHANFTRLSNARIAEEIARTNDAIFDAAGIRPLLMRPPYGSYNGRVIDQANMPIALWNIDPEDWNDQSAEAIYRHTIAHAKPGGVVLLHEIEGVTVQAVPRIIDELQRQGYVLVTMSDLFDINEKNREQFDGKLLLGR